MRWQRRARMVVAVVGIASAVAMYAAIGQRVKPADVAPLPRTDPSAMIESSGNVLQQVRGTKQDYLIEADRQLAYKGGATTLVGVRITTRNRGGRDYIVTGREAQAGENQRELRLSGGVTVAANDGFTVRTDVATFNQDSGLLTAPGAVTFGRGRTSGSGMGMSYDKSEDVLTLLAESHVVVGDEGGQTTLAFTAGRSVFARLEHTLSLTGTVHALHGDQIIDAAESLVHLTADEQHITDIELSGGSRVTGGGAGIEAMTARDMTLHYVGEDVLERVALRRDGAIAMVGKSDGPGLHLIGDTLDVLLAPDGSLASTSGGGNVRLELPGSAGISPKTIQAQSLDASGAPGKGLTGAIFAGGVEYREDAARGAAGRVARSRTLSLLLTDDAVSDARFAGGVTFEELELRATSADARYDPVKGSLHLTGGASGAIPRVSDARATIDGQAIDVVLEGRVMKATGAVKTLLRATAPSGGAGGATATKLPSLLRQDNPANVSADTLDYQGEAGQAVYAGNATLWQGETAIRGDVIAIDQRQGDLRATGNARSSIVFDTGVSIAHAAEITYGDAARTLTYSAASAAGGAGDMSSKATVAQPQVSGPQGDLHGNRIEVRLAEQGGRMDRLEASTNVTLRRDTRVATGARLTYFAADERYVMSGEGAKPVTIVEACKETTGKTLTFFGTSDRVIVDGNEEIRTQTKNGTGSACRAAPRSR